MLKDNVNSDTGQCSVFKMLFVLFLMVFAIAPIADAFTDSFCCSLAEFNDLHDSVDTVFINNINDLKLIDDRRRLHAFKRASKQYRYGQTLLQRTLLRDGPASPVIKRETLLYAVKSAQIYPPLSSDPSPPAV